MNEITFYAGHQPDSDPITESHVGKHSLNLKYSFQDYFSLPYLFILFALPLFRSIRKAVNRTRMLIDMPKWTTELLSIKLKSIINIGNHSPYKNIIPDVSHHKKLIYMYFKEFRVRPLTFSDLARLYHVTRKTIRRRAKRIGIVRTIGNFLSIAQIYLYVDHYNWPVLHVNPGI